MMPNILISYSRQCIGFVDDLAHRLQKRGFRVWLDYLCLMPGRPWVDQIQAGLEESELLLLVVSPESMSSRSVEIEWRHFLERKKRIILLIFQAVPLPVELSGLERVDFRGGYRSALRKLFRSIESPVPADRPAPQSGFKAPLVVWVAAALSVITAIYSVFAFWTFFIPWVLIPLPWRIFKRNFNLSQVQTALWTLPIGVFFTFGLWLELGFINENADFDYNNVFSLYNLVLFILFVQVYFVPLISLLLLVVLRSPGMQRWGRPEASVPKFANIYHPNIPRPQPVHFHIDHAPEDRMIARDLAAELTKYGHTPAEGLASAQEVLVLLSRFKTDTEADPEKQVVYPILVQRTKISEKLSQMQWIDFRKGVRNLEAIAQLLPQPAKMLAALGVRPTTGAQAAMPNIAIMLVDFLIIMGMVNVGSFLSYMWELAGLDLGMLFAQEPVPVYRVISLVFICMAISCCIIYLMVESLIERRGPFAAPLPFFLGFAAVSALFTWQALLGEELIALFMKYGVVSEPLFSSLPLLLLILGGLIVGTGVLFRYKTLRHWFPAKVK
jgi:hypothetical protein